MKKRQAIYILPTRFGVVFLLSTGLITMAGSAYQNNLINMVAYFMLGLSFIAAVATHQNLKGLTVESIEAGDAFAGDEFTLTTKIRNPSRSPRHQIDLRIDRLTSRSPHPTGSLIPALGQARVATQHMAPSRGTHRLRSVRLATSYPVGLFTAWMWLDHPSEYIVYPALQGSRQLPEPTDAGNSHTRIQAMSGDDFSDHRAFQSGDSHRHVDWKARARGRPLLIKRFNDGSSAVLDFDWRQTGLNDEESQLEQLALWIDLARQRRLPFSVRIPGFNLTAGEGWDHARRGWRALALYKSDRHIERGRNVSQG